MRAIRTTTISILALGLLAGSVAGVTAQDEQADPMAPSFFSGTVGDDWADLAQAESERRDDGVVEFTGASYSFPLEANDPRISGRATTIESETDYREGATTLASTGLDGTVRTVFVRIVNDNGSWEGEVQNLQIDGLGFEQTAGWLTGTDAYEGLSAYWVWDFADGSILGHITAEGPPATHELPTE